MYKTSAHAIEIRFISSEQTKTIRSRMGNRKPNFVSPQQKPKFYSIDSFVQMKEDKKNGIVKHTQFAHYKRNRQTKLKMRKTHKRWSKVFSFNNNKNAEKITKNKIKHSYIQIMANKNHCKTREHHKNHKGTHINTTTINQRRWGNANNRLEDNKWRVKLSKKCN